MSASDQADTLAAARAEVEQAREELGETVEALAHKADVKARAHDKADELKLRAQQTAQQARAKAQDAAHRLQAKAQETAAEVQARGGTLAEPTAVAPPPAPPTPQEEVQGRAPGGVPVVLARVRQVPAPALAGIAAGAAVLVAFLVARRRR
jgi:hypothetical protein